MFLATVIGSVVATKKDDAMHGRRMVLLRPMLVDGDNPGSFKPGSNTVVAVDCLGAGVGEMVLFCQGSSARMAAGLKTCPIDTAVVGIVDCVDFQGKAIYRAHEPASAS